MSTTRRAFLVLLALAALSWGGSWIAAPAPPATGAEPGHRVSSSPGEGPQQAVAAAGRTVLLAALRIVGDAGGTVTASGRALGWAALAIVLVAAALTGHALRRWRALLLGAPPVLDAHLR